jgi:thimet oligopeptidase
MRKVFFVFLLVALLPLLSSRPIVVVDKPAVASNQALIPEIDEVYNFARINEEAIKTAAASTESKVQMLLSVITDIKANKRDFNNTMLQLDEVYNTLQKSTSVYELITSTNTEKSIRDLAGEMLQKFTTITEELSLNADLYKAVKTYAETDEAKKLTGERAYFVKKVLQQFELNGMGLAVDLRDTLKAINIKINVLNIQFNKNISSDKTKVTCKKTEPIGLSDEFLLPFQSATGEYFFDLSTPTYTTIMSQCSNLELRKRMYMAKMNIGGAANEEIMVQILNLRARKAKILGFKTYSEYATADIMSQNTSTVWNFERGLAKDLRPKAEADLKVLVDIKNQLTGQKSSVIYPYEGAFYTNELLKTKYKVDQENIKQYFEIHNVIDGIFQVYQRLYNLSFEQDNSPSTWHSDVSAYTVFDNTTGERIGYFYLDLYPRADKYNHFGCFSLTGSKQYSNGKKQLRSAALVCNFPPQTAQNPSLLTHNSVLTFFHEFGHLIHVLLSETELAYFAGTNVATDFVEAPSQIMENWGWQKSVLNLFAKHHQTGEIIPEETINAMIQARNLNSGINVLQQVYYGTLDFSLNDGPPPADAAAIVKKTAELQNGVTMYPWVEGTHFAGSFGHLIGYASRYYGYQWSLVYAQDMFSKFEEEGDILSPETGRRYREEILSKGGSNDALQLVTKFLGREPNNKAYLKNLGL